MTLVASLLVSLAAVYASTLLWLLVGFKRACRRRVELDDRAATPMVSVIVPARTPVVEVQKPIREAAGELLQELSVFDIYRGAGLDEGQKSVSLHLVFRSDDRTLGAEEVESLQNAVIASLKDCGFPLR